MQRKSNLQLLAYSAMAGTYLLGSNKVDGQTIYFDIIPDQMIDAYCFECDETVTYYLDVNLDGINDLLFKDTTWDPCYYCIGGIEADVDALGDNKVVFISSSWESFYGWNIINQQFAEQLNVGDTLDGSDSLTNVMLPFGSLYVNDGSSIASWHGPWNDYSFHYVGFELKISGEPHYGWVRLKSNGAYILIDSYGYSEIAYEPIVIGSIPDCNPPLPNGEVAITGTTAKLRWFTTPADYFELQYRKSGTEIWTTKTVAGEKTFRKVVGLTCSTNYEWRIRSICADGSTSTYCPIQTFSTNSCKLENELENNEETIEIFSYGNNLNIQIDENINKEYNLKVFTITGELVYVNMIQGSENILQLDLPTGIYIVNLANEYVSINKTIAINN